MVSEIFVARDTAKDTTCATSERIHESPMTMARRELRPRDNVQHDTPSKERDAAGHT
jgi:hypothetical protein